MDDDETIYDCIEDEEETEVDSFCYLDDEYEEEEEGEEEGEEGILNGREGFDGVGGYLMEEDLREVIPNCFDQYPSDCKAVRDECYHSREVQYTCPYTCGLCYVEAEIEQEFLLDEVENIICTDDSPVECKRASTDEQGCGDPQTWLHCPKTCNSCWWFEVSMIKTNYNDQSALAVLKILLF